MPLQDLVTQRGNNVGFQGSRRSAAELIVGLCGGQNLVLQFTGTIPGSVKVDTESGDIGAFTHGALFDQGITALDISGTEGISGVASTGHSVLFRDEYDMKQLQ